MRRIRILFLFWFFAIPCSSFCQQSDVEFLAQKIKTVYGGFEDKVTSCNFENLINKLKSDSTTEIFLSLSKLTNFFKDQHLVLYQQKAASKEDTIQCKKNVEFINEYFQKKQDKMDNREGYWIGQLNDYAMVLLKDSTNPKQLNAYIMESRGRIMQGYHFMSLKSEESGSFITDYSDPFYGFRIISSSTFNSDQLLFTKAYGYWNKVANYSEGILEKTKEFSFTPSLEILDPDNIVLTMPDFSARNVKLIDSLISRNASILETTKNLIIDIRENAGGTIKSYFSLLPYVYTKPIVSCDGYTRCSQELIDDKLRILKKYIENNDTARIKTKQHELNKIIENKNHFLFNKGDTLIKNSVIKSNPKNIGIIANRNSLSAAELMILNFKQSAKIKFFGESTGGAVDYLDAIRIDMPSGKYYLNIAVAKRSAPEKYDLNGIPPDIVIPRSEQNWVQFVKKYYATFAK